MTGSEALSPSGRRYRLAEDTMLDAACTVFAREGFDGAKMSAIAALAGTTKPTLYARFGTKEKLFTAAVRREHRMLNERVYAAYDGSDDLGFRERLHAWCAAYFDFVKERPDGFRLTFESERHAAALAAITEATNDRIDRIAQLVTRVSGRPPGAGPRVVAAMIVGMLRACVQETLRHPGTDLDAAAALCESMLRQALLTMDRDMLDAVSSSRPASPGAPEAAPGAPEA